HHRSGNATPGDPDQQRCRPNLDITGYRKDGVSTMLSAQLRRPWPWLLMLGVVLIAGWAIVESGQPGSDKVADLSADEFGKRVRDCLLAHPEVILESVERLQSQDRAKAANQDGAAIANHADQLFRDPDTPVGGNPDGDVSMVEFFDYNCPY